MFPGLGTVINIVAVLVGGSLGLLLRHRFPAVLQERTTDALALVVFVIGMLSAWSVTDTAFSDEVGTSAPMLIVLFSVVLGTLLGTVMRIEHRITMLGEWLQERFARTSSSAEASAEQVAAKTRGVQGFLTASVLFCVGPLTILGSIQDGMGQGFDLLAVKSVLDGFASIAFAAAMGPMVLASAGVVAVVQGSFTALGAGAGEVLNPGQVSALSAVGGVLMLGLCLRLLKIRDLPVGDMLPAVFIAPALVWVVGLIL